MGGNQGEEELSSKFQRVGMKLKLRKAREKLCLMVGRMVAQETGVLTPVSFSELQMAAECEVLRLGQV